MQIIYIGENMERKEYYTIDDVAQGINEFIPIPKRSQANYRKKGLLPHLKVGRQIYYTKQHLKQLFISLESINTKAD
jgi:hypothetical protein